MDIVTWLQGQTAAQFLFWFVATVSIIAVVAKSWSGITGFVTAVNAITELNEFMTHTKAELEVIKHEVLPNSGKSLRDAVDLANGRMESLETRTEQIEVLLDKMSEREEA